MLGEDAKRRTVVEPPMPGAAGYDAESLPRYFAEIKAVDADVTYYAIAFDLVDAWEEDDLRRRNESGY